MGGLVATLVAMMSWSPHVRHTERCQHVQKARALAPLVQSAAQITGLAATVIASVAVTEGGGRLTAVSSAGAVGPMQILPHGRAAYLCKDLRIHRAGDNVVCGARLLKDARARCGGAAGKWLSAYNNYPCGETNYSRRILATAARAGVDLNKE